MARAKTQSKASGGCEVIDFDEALLDACPAALLVELMAEAELLASAFAPRRRRDDLEAMAAELSAGRRDGEMNRARARRLAAALRRLARQR